MLAGALVSALKSQAIYTASLTSLRDSMPLWREYTESGDGIAIGFRPRALTDMHCRIQKIRYINSDDNDEVFHLVSEFVKEMEQLGYWDPSEIFKEEEIKIRIEVISSLISIIYSVKSHGWSYEDELRLSFASGREGDEETRRTPVTLLPDGQPVYWSAPKRRTAKFAEVAYYELPFGKFTNGKYDASSSISEIVVGSNASVSIKEINGIILEGGMNLPEIRKSEHVFR